ncbi:MAG: 5'(3')-deoxyribonucleotidase [Pseudomonadota bacterium]
MKAVLDRPKIAVDMDHVMADTGLYLCDWLNDRFGTSYQNESFVSFLRSLPEPERQVMVDHVTEGTLMRHLPLMEGCVEVLEDLNKRYAIVICTAAMEFPNTIMPKIEWLKEHFPFLDPHLFVFCGPKQVMGTDYLIDDSPKHFPGFKGMPVLYDAPHNVGETRYDRVMNWADIADYFD